MFKYGLEGLILEFNISVKRSRFENCLSVYSDRHKNSIKINIVQKMRKNLRMEP